jgi:pilus assembly protein CpaF
MPVLNEATVITWMDTFQKCLQTKPDRIILDEIRTGEEAYYFLTALSAGHTGSMATMHASGIYDRLQRLELLIKDYKTDIDNITIRTFIADSLDILVFLNIQKDKESDNVIRTIKELAEINGLKNDGSYNLKYIIPR